MYYQFSTYFFVVYTTTLVNLFSNVDQTVVRDFTDFLLLLRQIYNQVANTFLDHAGIPFQSPFFIEMVLRTEMKCLNN